ncbi:MAG: glycosyltransferase family 4 protein [Myxococcaceae bacterium]
MFHSYSWPLHLAVPILDLLRGQKISVSHGYGALVWVPVPKFPFGLGALAMTAIQSLLMLRWITKIDRLVFLSNRLDFCAFYDHALARIAKHKGIEIIPNGVDLDEKPSDLQGFRNQIGADHASIIFLCVANYSKRKDQGFAARAFRKAAIYNSFLVFIGSEFNEFSEVFQKADSPWDLENSPGKIIWMEKVSREVTANALAGCDVFVLSASHEAQPISLLEAMREGKPWIARDAGCISEMPGGLCVKTVDSMAHAMKDLVSKWDFRCQLGLAGRYAVETTFNREAYASSYCRLVEELVKKNIPT